jgi:hypothetical protein
MKNILFWRFQLARIEERLVGLHAGSTPGHLRHDLIAAWHGVNGLLAELEASR